MGLLNGFKLLGYGTGTLGVAYISVQPLLEALGLGSWTGLFQADLKLLLLLATALLLAGVTTILLSGYLVLGGWKGAQPVPRRLRLLLAFPVGVLILVLGGALSFLIPIPVLPIIIAALLVWSTLKFTSSQVFPPEPFRIGVDSAEELAVKFWRSRSPEDKKPIARGATLDGDNWIITLTGKERTGTLDIDARSGIVTGWRFGE